jgi:uncharacterized protein
MVTTAEELTAGSQLQSSSQPTPSRFVWYELHTSNPEQAHAFYTKVLGWKAQDAGMPGKEYSIFLVGETGVAGVLKKPESAFTGRAKAWWMGYIGVNNVDAFAERVVTAGGAVRRAAEDIPGVGRFAVVADPQGAIFTLFEPNPSMSRTELPPKTPGTFAWHDLAAAEWQSDFEFYSKLFGWSKATALDMGPEYGTYQIFAAGNLTLGGMMTRVDKNQAPGWMFYINVEDIDAAIARAVDAGGTITHGPSTVPTGERIANCLDPQGAIFGMVAPGKPTE